MDFLTRQTFLAGWLTDLLFGGKDGWMDIDKMIANFDKALTHPDKKDIEGLIEAVLSVK